MFTLTFRLGHLDDEPLDTLPLYHDASPVASTEAVPATTSTSLFGSPVATISTAPAVYDEEDDFMIIDPPQVRRPTPELISQDEKLARDLQHQFDRQFQFQDSGTMSHFRDFVVVLTWI